MQLLLEMVVGNSVMAVLLALVAAAVSQVCRRPAVVHGLWLLVLLKLVTPPLFPIPLSWPETKEQQPASDSVHVWKQQAEMGDRVDGGEFWFLEAADSDAIEEPARPQEQSEGSIGNATQEWVGRLAAWAEPIRQVAAPLWLASSAMWFVWAAIQVARFQRLLRYARPAPHSMQALVQHLGEQLGLAQTPEVVLVPGAVSPMLWAIGGRPRLLFPIKLLEQLDADQRASLLAHELAHLRRRDHWVRLLEMAVLGLYWWHPVVWWARRELREAEEQCCDAWVVWALAADRAYATALVQAVAFVSRAPCAPPIAASAIGHTRQLRRRLTMIMQGKTPRSLSWAGGLMIVGIAVLLLPLLPVRAQDKPSGDKEQVIVELKRLLKQLQDQEDAGAKLADRKKAVDALGKALQSREQKTVILKLDDLKKDMDKSAAPEAANADLAALNRDIEKMRAELHLLEAKRAKLLAQIGAPAGADAQTWRFHSDDGKTIIYKVPESGAWKIESGKPAATAVFTAPKKDGESKTFEYKLVAPTKVEDGKPQKYEYRIIKPDTKFEPSKEKESGLEQKAIFYLRAAEAAKAKTGTAAERTADLEKRLDQLMQELKELRSEMQQRKK